MTEHTPTPWRGERTSVYTVGLIDNEGHQFGEVYLGNTPKTDEIAMEITARMFRAVNSHAALVEALEAAKEYLDERADAEYLPGKAAPVGNEEMGLLADIRAALAKAKED